jgi:hypothetical protein
MAVGATLECARCRGPRDEVAEALDWLGAAHREGRAWRELALVVPGKRKWIVPVVAELDARGIPHRLLVGRPGAEPDFAEDALHAVSLYTPIACAAIAIVGLGDLPWKTQPLDEAARAVRSAVAGASAAVRLSWSKESALVATLIDA